MAVKSGPAPTKSKAEPKDLMAFSFADTIAGYVKHYDRNADTFVIETSDGRAFTVALTDTTIAMLVHNLGEPYVDATAQMRDMLVPGRYMFTYGVFYPQGGAHVYEAKQLTFPGSHAHDYVWEKPDWWVKQIWQMADFYMKAEFGDGEPNWREYRVGVDMTGHKMGDRQETDTISRLIYGLSTAYHMTGEDRFLVAAEAGVEYLREHLRNNDTSEGVTYWYHAIEIDEPNEKKILASEFGDDYQAIPAYEQIYALVGPAQVFRITGDKRIHADIDTTVSLFERFFYDPEYGGYWSHLDPISFDGKSDALGRNRARKNWNSVGDHIPAYLINTWLATGDDKYLDMLVSIADTIEERFPDDDNSPFVQERFHEDWSHDVTWGWQQNRAVVGHNLKIAWNLMRIHHARPHAKYVALANKINRTMPAVGSDEQRGGWYDVVERVRKPGEKATRFTWHDRKAWWQQEQAILAYQIMAGSTGDEEALRLGKEAASFYNAFFFDYEEGSVYFNVLANGIPYLVGTERQKGSHSMAGYHSFELAYLSTVYTNLLITKEPMDLWFSPIPGDLPDDILRVAPDILPPGSIRIGSVEVDGAPYADFDADGLTVKVPDGKKRVKIRVRIVPTTDPFEATTTFDGDVAEMTLVGKLDQSTYGIFQAEVEDVLAKKPARLVLMLAGLESIANVGIRVLLFARQRMDISDRADIYAVAPNAAVREALIRADPDQEDINVVESYDPFRDSDKKGKRPS
jgi:mannose/cellobiose epimerase-like protein (N-acyl-D-glucosamine 2-epimerase family)/anti-anti-sigma regulatory factor